MTTIAFRIAAAALFALLIGVSTAEAQVTIDHGGLWRIDVRASLKACLSGHCTSDTVTDTQEFSLPSGAIVNVGVLVGGCAGVIDPAQLAEVSSYVPRKRGGLKLKVTSVRRLNALLKGCTGYRGFKLSFIKGNLRLAPDGNSFDTTVTANFTLLAQDHTLSASLVAKVHGALVGDGDGFGAELPPASVDPIAPAVRLLGLSPG